MSEAGICDKCHTTLPHFVCDPPPWATRIPAAIKRAKEVGDVYLPTDPVKDTATSPRFMLTAGEVALAEALMEAIRGEVGTTRFEAALAETPELIAFTEKVEKLT